MTTDAKSKIEWPEHEKGRPIARSQRNIRAFLDHRGILLRHNAFSLRDEVLRDGRVLSLDDPTLRTIRLEADAMGLSPHRDYFDDVIYDAARANTIHPVLQYIERIKWDGLQRLERLGSTYAGATDSPLTRAQIKATFIAAVRRIRCPGSKFDNCLVLEGEQNAGKSTAVRVLAGDNWFTDSLQIGTDPKDTIEQTSGKWICELPELVGLGKKGRERVKAFLSRSVDRAALKYERLARDVPRQFICIATVNLDEYLDDPTGNRRFWPIRVGTIDIAGLKRDRDQIWAEAAALEADGESTELPRELWDAASAEEKKRLIRDPWLDRLEPIIGDQCGAVAKDDLWTFLNIEAHRQDRYAGVRVSEVMKHLDFIASKRRRSGDFRHGAPIPCFVRDGWGEGPPPWLLQDTLLR